MEITFSYLNKLKPDEKSVELGNKYLKEANEFYNNMDETEINTNKAIELYKKSINKSANIEGILALADIYYYKYSEIDNKSEVDVIYKQKAMQLYQFAAERDNATACAILGDIYYYGDNANTKNEDIACKYYKIAARQNDIHSLKQLGDFYRYRSDKTSVKFLEKAASLDDLDAIRLLAKLYFNSTTCKDYKKGILNYIKASEMGCKESLISLSRIYYNGEGVLKDYKLAVHYLELAAEKKHPIAYKYLGYSYKDGTGVSKDYTKAFYYFLLAAELGSSRAYYELGVMKEKGLGVVQDIKDSLYYYNLSAKLGFDCAIKKLLTIYHDVNSDCQDWNKYIHILKIARKKNLYSDYHMNMFFFDNHH